MGTGSGNGFRGETQVKVVVKNKKISSIEIMSYQDDEQFFERAKETVIANIIKNSIDVDTISGATFSSNGIKEAVANASKFDFTNPNSSSLYQEHHHH
ncbi:FMN-binding domain-containing protein [Kandleria vitulina]|uniref:FMN-binding protein n=1 Tax=Kandleria vitulina TaxID=1630 RepID=UPI0008D4F82B|nr:FMN-binding protein [Kandleria vitulina]SEJ37070.1 FMN-binding domain-containing protein [Kandleria vitulina]